MKKIFGFFFFLIVGMGVAVFCLLFLRAPFDSYIGYPVGIVTLVCLFYPRKQSGKKNDKSGKTQGKIKIENFAWSINDFCRGWLITGQTGSGKTACAIRTILHALFQNVPEWGGAIVDQKGQFYEIVAGTARHYGMEDKLCILRIGGDSLAKYNILSYPGISWQSYAGIIIDTAESMGIKLEAFWKSNSEQWLYGILGLVASERIPTLADLVKYTYDSDALKALVKRASAKTDPITQDASQKVQGILNLPAVTLGGVLGSVKTIINYFNDPAIQEVLCPKENTVDFRDVDKGKIFVISMAQKYDRQRVFFNTFLKLLFMTHAKYRFDDPENLPKKNLLVFFADEAQQIVTSSAYASDHEAVSVIREAKATYVLATQSVTSFLSRLKKEDVQALVLNLSSKMYFTVADQEAAELASKDLGVFETDEISKSVSKGVETISTRKAEKAVYTAAELRALRKYECVLKHPSGKTERMFLPPRDDAGNVPKYYYKDRFGLFWFLPWLFQL